MECKSVDVNSDIKVKGKLAVGDSEDIGKDFTDIKKKTDDISNDFTDMKKKLAPGREKPGEGGARRARTRARTPRRTRHAPL